MTLERRRFLGYLGAAAAAAAAPTLDLGRETPGRRSPPRPHDAGRPGAPDWEDIRSAFPLDPDYIHLAGLYLTSHPRSVAADIEEHRRALDANPVPYLQEHHADLDNAVREAAAAYLGADPDDFALTDSTTMGIALVYNGIAVRDDQELLTTTHDYYATHASLRYKARRSGASLRIVEPFDDSAEATADGIAERILGEVRDETRVLALTWVHSWTGVKIPVRAIAEGLRALNADRDPDDRVLLCLDGVHGLGVEDIDLPDLGCDFFMAGTHKWMFAPRGTGILWGRPETQDAVTPTIPPFGSSTGWGWRMTPNGFKPFEHRWAAARAFDLHREIGRSRVTGRIHELNRHCKEGLAGLSHVRVRTPMDESVSAGMVAFDVDGMSAAGVVRHLRERNIVASVTPYSPPHARLAPGLLNNASEIDATLEIIAELG